MRGSDNVDATSDQSRLQRHGVSSWMGRGREPRSAKSLNSSAAPDEPCPQLRLRAAPLRLPEILPAQNRLPSHDPSKRQPLEIDMINNATFQIIGRIGNINAQDKVTHISVASDRQVKGDDGKWSTKADWNTVTIFSEALRKRLANAKVGKKGNQVIFQGSIQTNAYEKDGEKVYKTNLVAQDFDVLSFAKDSE